MRPLNAHESLLLLCLMIIFVVVIGLMVVYGLPPSPSDEICGNYESNWGSTFNRPVSSWEIWLWDFYQDTCECHWDYVCQPGYEERYECHVERCNLK